MQNIAIARHLLLTLGLFFATSLHSYSQAFSIKIITVKADNYVLRNVDNCSGISVYFGIKKSKLLRLIYRLSNQIGGSAEYTLNGGAMFLIRFKDAVTRNKDA